jgi:hypothetical protein
MDCFVALLLAMTSEYVGCAKRSVPTTSVRPHPEEPRSGVSKDEWHQSGLMVRDGALRLLTMRVTADHIGRTSTTSGTKCFSRFWMPCCNVAVEDGQPAQEPFMLR